MSLSPFAVAREIGTNLSGAMTKVRDENAIESILSNAMSSNDPSVLQDSIGKILSQVSPERQQVAVQYLQGIAANIENKQKMARDQAAAKEAGYTYGAPPQVAAAQVREKAKGARLAQFGLGNTQSQFNLPNAENGTPLALQGGEPSSAQPGESVFKKLSDDQLISMTGAPDREVSEPAKAELKRRDEERNLKQKEKESWTKFGQDLAKKVLERTDEIAEALPQKESALNLAQDAIARKDLGFFTWDNLAEISGLEGLRSKEGAIFKTAMKEFLLGSIARAGTRPNQWIEQQISDMAAKIGRSTEANLSVVRAIKNEIDIEKERLRLTDEIFDKIRNQGGDIGKLGSEVNKQLAKFAEQKQNELFNDLRAIKAIGENKPQKFNKVSQGSKISPYMVDALLNAFNNDDVKALNEAKKLGYSVE